jgi:hypothetical protein
MIYLVSWTIEIEAESPQEAAEKALEIQQDPDSIATVFDVASNGQSQAITIDLTPGEGRPHDCNPLY